MTSGVFRDRTSEQKIEDRGRNQESRSEHREWLSNDEDRVLLTPSRPISLRREFILASRFSIPDSKKVSLSRRSPPSAGAGLTWDLGFDQFGK